MTKHLGTIGALAVGGVVAAGIVEPRMAQRSG